MELRYRALAESETGQAADLFLTALRDMAARNGQSVPASYTREFVLPRYAHLRRTGIFRVAEADGKIVSICSAIVRDELWFLSMFWTLPEWQQRGVGTPLLKQVWQQGREQGARVDFTWSSIDFAAIATYMKLGMLPGCQIFTFAGSPAALPPPPPGYVLEDLERDSASNIDRKVRGTAREQDHAFWSSGGIRYRVRAGGEIAGYFYVFDGVIGPAAWSGAEHAQAVLALALRAAGEQVPEIKLMAAGMNHSAIRAALGAGLRLAGSSHLLCSRPFGALDQYLPSGPVLF
jgi:GNAT superfamily N-acetyltransferase